MHSSQLNCFVANRISGIQTKSSNISRRHVPGKVNPADIISRGCKVSELQNTSWFMGPTFLKLEEHLWPQSLDKIETIDADLEIRKISSFKCTESKENILEQVLNRISSYHRVHRVTAYVLRAFNKIPASENHCMSEAVEMPATELQHSFLFIVGLIQHQTYWKEIDCLRKGNVPSADLQRLTPFLSESAIGSRTMTLIRVGGRLENAQISVEAKYPL